MKCVICKQGETKPGNVTVTLERKGMILVIRGVPARVCAQCGEEYVETETKDRLLYQAEETARSGVQAAISDYHSK